MSGTDRGAAGAGGAIEGTTTGVGPGGADAGSGEGSAPSPGATPAVEAGASGTPTPAAPAAPPAGGADGAAGADTGAAGATGGAAGAAGGAPAAETLLTEAGATGATGAAGGAPEGAGATGDAGLVGAQYEPFTMPEGLPEGASMNEEVIKEFTGIIAPHNLPQEAAQSLLALHAAEIQKVHAAEQARQLDVFHDMVGRWGKEFKDDTSPDFMNQHDTIVARVKGAIGDYGGTPQQQAELRWVLATSGLGNNKALIRWANNMLKAIPANSTKAIGGNPEGARSSVDPAGRRYPNMKT